MNTVEQELQAVVEAGRMASLRWALGAGGFGAFNGDVAALSDFDATRLDYVLRAQGFAPLADAVKAERAASVTATVETVSAGAGADSLPAANEASHGADSVE